LIAFLDTLIALDPTITVHWVTHTFAPTFTWLVTPPWLDSHTHTHTVTVTRYTVPTHTHTHTHTLWLGLHMDYGPYTCTTCPWLGWITLVSSPYVPSWLGWLLTQLPLAPRLRVTPRFTLWWITLVTHTPHGYSGYTPRLRIYGYTRWLLQLRTPHVAPPFVVAGYGWLRGWLVPLYTSLHTFYPYIHSLGSFPHMPFTPFYTHCPTRIGYSSHTPHPPPFLT